MNDKVLNMKMPSELYEKLKRESEKNRISLASFVRLICSEYLEKEAE